MNTVNRGFTLVELMIVVAIVAIITAIALPGYQGQVRDSRRADCTAVLMQGRQMMERFYTKNYTYAGAVVGTDTPAKCPIDGNNTHYNLAFVGTPDATGFTLQATRANAQVSDACGDLTINQAGQKTASGGTVDDCWY